MAKEKDRDSGLMGTRRARIYPAAELATWLLVRAERQHSQGVRLNVRVRAGLRALDSLRGIWWGLTVLHGGEHHTGSDHVTLAARIALETARSGEPVLWFSLTGNEEAPVFRLLTGIARVPVRDVFVDRRLGPREWEALGAARAELASLPLLVGDAHGLTLEELRASCLEARRGSDLALLIVDGIDGFDRVLLPWLERVGQEMDAPVLAVVTTPDGAPEEPVGFTEVRPTALIRTSPVLHVRRVPSAQGTHPAGLIPLFVDVLRVGEPDLETVGLRLDPTSRWIEDAYLPELPPDGEIPK